MSAATDKAIIDISEYAVSREPIARLRDAVEAIEAERDRWKALAEFHYGMKAYPQDVGLGRGALDAFFRREWDNGRYEQFLEQAEQAANRGSGGIR